ncbi:HAMP domain-containing sensor histidine kinase [Haloarculaceae archaeon H-GB2-1]|nr:HAMP domain-containing sensor histidine kinase [Haloarculaceae archaeon H-GB2-1]
MGVTLLGISLVGAALAYAVSVDTETGGLLYPLVDFLVLVSLASTVTYSGYYLGKSDVEPKQLWTVATSVGLGIIVMATLMGWQLLAQLRMGGVVQAPLVLLVVTQSVGAVIGLLVGIYHIETIRKERKLQEARTAAREAREENDQLEFLNHLLRHHMFNGVQVVRSYATILGDHVDESGQSHIETIQYRSDRLVAIVDNMRVLVQSLTDDHHLDPQSLATAIENEIEVLGQTYDQATFEVHGLDDQYVSADSLLPAVFENLLRNAIEHNTATDPHVTVRVETTDETVAVHIIDNGDGPPDGIEEKFLQSAELRDPTAKEGTGLYIANRLVTKYGGDIHLEDDAGTDSARFVVELPLATAPS